MALDILHDNWGPYTHTEVENALKAYLTVLENRINQAIQSGGVGLADLSAEVRALLNKANTALQPENIAAWAKAQNKPGYNVSEITYSNLLTLAQKLDDMDQKIQAAASSGVDPDDTMSDTSENGVQNKVIKAYVDAVSQRIDTLIGSGNVQGAIDTFNEVKAFLDDIDTSDPTLANQLLALNNAINNAGKVKSVSVNGTNHTPDSNGVVDLGTIQGAKGDKGEKGDTVVIDPDGLARFEIANDLDTSDPTQGLSARQGKILKQAISTVQANLQAVVEALANIAFTSEKPALNPIDWTGGTFYATIVKSLTGCTATDNTTNGQLVEGQTLTMQLTASSGFALTGATISVTNSKGQSVAYTLNGNTLSVANVTGTITVSVVAVGVFSVSLGSGSSNVAFASGTSIEATSGSSWTGTIEAAASGYKLPASITVTMGGTAITPTYNSTSGEITIANVTGNIVITAVAEEVGKVTITKSLRNVTLADNADGNNKIAEGSDYAATIAAITKNVVDLYRLYADASPHANFTNYGTPMKVVQSPAGVVASGASITYNQDGTASVVKDDIDADLAITAVAESRIKAGYGYNSGSSHTPAEYAGKGCTESIIPIPQGINYLEWKHNAATNGYTSTGGGRGGINLNVLVISAGGAFTGLTSAGVTASSEDITYLVVSQSSPNVTKFMFASFPIGSTAEQQRALLDQCYIKGYTVSDPSNPDITGLTPVVLFDGSKAEII